MNGVPDRRALTWAVIYALTTVVVMGGIVMGAAVYRQSIANGGTSQRIEDIAQRIEDCIDPEGACGLQAAETRAGFADVLNQERHQDLAAAIVCARRNPRASTAELVLCIERKER